MNFLIIGIFLCAFLSVGEYLIVLRYMDQYLTFSGKRKKRIRLFFKNNKQHELRYRETYLITYTCKIVTFTLLFVLVIIQLIVYFVVDKENGIRVASDVSIFIMCMNGLVCSVLDEKYKRKRKEWLLAHHEEATKQKSSEDQTE